MEKKTIWHTPDEKPEDGATIAFYLEDSMGYGDYDYDENEILVNCGFIEFSRITKWAYVSDLIATSKALDAAIDALKQIQWFCYTPTMGERAGRMQQCADKTLNEIEKIMKGGK